jgi:hypothetical protein
MLAAKGRRFAIGRAIFRGYHPPIPLTVAYLAIFVTTGQEQRGESQEDHSAADRPRPRRAVRSHQARAPRRRCNGCRRVRAVEGAGSAGGRPSTEAEGETWPSRNPNFTVPSGPAATSCGAVWMPPSTRITSLFSCSSNTSATATPACPTRPSRSRKARVSRKWSRSRVSPISAIRSTRRS